MPAGDLVRIGPSALRYLTNRSSEPAQEWLMIGAPPDGTIDDYGEYIVHDEAESATHD